MQPNWQPQLSNELVYLRPLQADDFDTLYAVASDPLIWEQHPNPDRYKREVFTNYFTGAMESGGALLISDATSNEVVGCSRFYDYLPEQSEVKIGYTFFSRTCWGKGINRAVKHLMIAHALQYAHTIIFHVGANNLRSRKAMEKLGARLIGEEEVAYYGEASRLNVVYAITKQDWQQ
jgi:N-acetyltransferase